MGQVMDEETKAFLADIEQRRGGQITFKTFSTFYADNSGKLCQDGVFFYRVGGQFWFQDFEHVSTFLGFILTKKKDPDYQMFESSFSPSDVVSIRKVWKKSVIRCALYGKDFFKLRRFNPVLGFLSESATEFTMKDGRLLYFQFMDKTVQEMIIRRMNKNDKEGD